MLLKDALIECNVSLNSTEGAQVLAGKHVTNVKYDKRNKCVLLGLDDGNEVKCCF